MANKRAVYIPENNTFYHDFIQLSVNLFLDIVPFESDLHQMAQLKRNFEINNDKSKLEQAIFPFIRTWHRLYGLEQYWCIQKLCLCSWYGYVSRRMDC
jgi:hypothetical protein